MTCTEYPFPVDISGIWEVLEIAREVHHAFAFEPLDQETMDGVMEYIVQRWPTTEIAEWCKITFVQQPDMRVVVEPNADENALLVYIGLWFKTKKDAMYFKLRWL